MNMKIIKYKDQFFIELQSSIDSSDRSITMHLQNIASGEEIILNDNYDKFEFVSILDAIPAFFEAQWIGEANLEKMTIAMMQEVSEAFNELDWKPWKNQSVNLENYREELADVGIFLLLTSKLADMSFEELLYRMIKKHLFNLVRIDHKNKRLVKNTKTENGEIKND